MVTAIIGEMTIVFVITLQACNLLPNEKYRIGEIDYIVLFANTNTMTSEKFWFKSKAKEKTIMNHGDFKPSQS